MGILLYGHIARHSPVYLLVYPADCPGEIHRWPYWKLGKQPISVPVYNRPLEEILKRKSHTQTFQYSMVQTYVLGPNRQKRPTLIDTGKLKEISRRFMNLTCNCCQVFLYKHALASHL